MSRYRLTVAVDFEADDDPQARERLVPLQQIASLDPFVSGRHFAVLRTAKLQRLYDTQPPRALLAYEQSIQDG